MPPTRARRQLRVRQIAHDVLGYDRLRPGQEEAIRAVLDGRDTLAVLPTGLGKSAIYQLAGTQLEGPTVVVSPLIALQRDQLESIEGADLPSAAALNSAISNGEREEIFDQLADGSLEFLFLAPEQFANDEVLEKVRAAEPSLFVVDEAHCICDWGHDFRPEYLRLGAVVEALGGPVVLALTATAAPPVRQEIVDRLGMEDAAIVVRGFDRPNIHLAVEHFSDDEGKRAAFVERVEASEKPVIVYAGTRKRTEELADLLSESGVSVAAYHGAMAGGLREQVEGQFAEGAIDVIVATTAFGMGIDKADVRMVLHFDIADSVDAYYQEVGRAGRDGERAEGLLFFRPEDMALRRFFGGSADIDPEEFGVVLEAIGSSKEPVTVEELSGRVGDLPVGKLRAAIDHLESAGALEVGTDGTLTLTPTSEARAIEQAEDAAERRRMFDRTRLEMIRGYAETRDCRREYLLSYLGEAYQGPCGNCDNCEAGSEQAIDQGEQPFPLQGRVRHEQFGAGSVTRYEPGRVVVLFDDTGYRTLNLDLVMKDGLLRAIDGSGN